MATKKATKKATTPPVNADQLIHGVENEVARLKDELDMMEENQN